MSMLLFCGVACVLVFVIGLRSDTKLNAAYLFTNNTHRQEKESFQELHSDGDKDAIAAAAKTRLVTVRTTVATPSKTASKMDAGESLSTKGNVSVYHRYAVQTDVTIVAEKQQEEGKTGSDPSGHRNATNRNGGSRRSQSLSTDVAAAIEREWAFATNTYASRNGTDDGGRSMTMGVH
ncbi:hypothetical protein HPB51_021847 [Rhipicephalus microplus]|uniref:Secreted protein n=1 Tax=Rhipicephalus microplus TaxID=6941 RepID=A0A9J6E4K2_RHIMP|nr:hypothetical protein HPB51_021847 [Rhipicephalus microplus]